MIYAGPQTTRFPNNVLRTRSTVVLTFSYLPTITHYLLSGLKTFVNRKEASFLDGREALNHCPSLGSVYGKGWPNDDGEGKCQKEAEDKFR